MRTDASLRIVRREIKYQINLQEVALLKMRLDRLMTKDEYSAKGPYFIRSLYFDNILGLSYYQKLEGVDPRKKFRIRFYDFASTKVKFEIKMKNGDRIDKRTAWIRVKDVEKIMSGDYDCLLEGDDPTLRQVYYDFIAGCYEPAVLVDYHRDAYVLDYNHIRVTFDTGLRKSKETGSYRMPGLVTVPAMDKGLAIMEVKYNDFLPGWLKDALEVARYQQCASSKYCLARMI